MSHVCAVPGCGWKIDETKLMCLTHWQLVPSYKQRQVTVEWTAIRTAGSAQKRQAAQLRYLGARKAAVDSIAHLAPLL